MKSFARSLLYESWANHRVLECLREAPAVDLRAVQIFAHVVAAQQIWLARLRGESTEEMETWPDWNLNRCAQALREAEAGLAAYERELTPEMLDARITYRNSRGTEYSTGAHDVLRHLNRHGVYHRGQIAIHLKRSGAEPPVTDYVGWVREREGQPVR